MVYNTTGIKNYFKFVHSTCLFFLYCRFLTLPCPKSEYSLYNDTIHLFFMSCLSYLDTLQMGSKWPYSCSFIGYCFQDLINIAHSILVRFPSRFFSICIVAILTQLLLGRNPIIFYQIAVQAFSRCITTHIGHCWKNNNKLISEIPLWNLAQSAGAVEYTDCHSAEG